MPSPSPSPSPGRAQPDPYKGLYVAPPQPPSPRSFPTVALVPSYPAGNVVDPVLFLSSADWVEPLGRDVEDLLRAFEVGWVVEGEGEGEGGGSPVEVFRREWVKKGWAKVGLVGGLGEAERVRWGLAMARAFLGEWRREGGLVGKAQEQR